MLKKRITALLMGTVLVGTLAVGCSSSGDDQAKGNGSEKSSKITISGSTSIGPTMEVLGEKFQEANNGVAVEVQQVGSSAGIKNTIDGTSEIGMASRDLKDEEKSAGLTETQIAIDGIAVIVNKNNEVKDLTLDQIKGIYTGKITNWKEVGGKDTPIVVVSREDGSGTRDGFQENVGFESEELTKEAQISDGSGNIKSTVEGNENAIGYISHGYVDQAVFAVKVDGVDATEETIKDKTYVIQRPFIIVHKEDKLSENGKKLIDFILSDEGQDLVASKGFVKIK
ncbi:phosphate ABC transporter substrate-binding protein [Romboutsia sp.]|uniref:phosphate ABC transporter substrate-binding protein n=1 Tax=Romboutsia sp. TaxID=1965302 RepID=UPI003F3B4076